MSSSWSIDQLEDICFDDALLPFLAGSSDATYCNRSPLHPRCELLDAAHGTWAAWEASTLAADGSLALGGELYTPVVTLRVGESPAAFVAGTVRGAALPAGGGGAPPPPLVAAALRRRGGSRLCEWAEPTHNGNPCQVISQFRAEARARSGAWPPPPPPSADAPAAGGAAAALDGACRAAAAPRAVTALDGECTAGAAAGGAQAPAAHGGASCCAGAEAAPCGAGSGPGLSPESGGTAAGARIAGQVPRCAAAAPGSAQQNSSKAGEQRPVQQRAVAAEGAGKKAATARRGGGGGRGKAQGSKGGRRAVHVSVDTSVMD